MTYTADDYRKLGAAINSLTLPVGESLVRRSVALTDHEIETVLSAISIAARVMEPGVIEAACMMGTELRRKVDAAAIRTALTEPARPA